MTGPSSERCPGCGGDAGNNWFDRSLCAPPCDSMHTRCRNCGIALDGCVNDEESGPSSERTADADAAVGEYEADQYVHVYRRPDAAQHRPPEGVRTADADVAHICEFLEWHHEHRGGDCGAPGPCSCSSLPALDRLAALVAQHRDTQETLERIASGDINWQACKAEARAALTSVRARSET